MTTVGIDLGTYNSAIAYINKHGGVEVIPNAEGEPLTPSVVFFDDDQIIVGKIAKQNAILEHDNVVSNIKREMGKSDYFFKHNAKDYSPSDLSSFILKKLKKDAEAQLGEIIKEAVITVPAHFDQSQRAMTEEAAKLAGISVKQIINEPTAAALAYGLDNIDTDQKILVYDLGGGTFDVTIMEIKDNELTIINNEGDPELGGIEWDNRIIEYIVDEFKKAHNEDPLEDIQTHQVLKENAERAKENISSRQKVKINCSYNGKTNIVELTLEKFEELTRDLLARTETFVNQAMKAGNIGWQDIGTILMVGGSCKMPMVEKMLEILSGGTVPEKAKSLDQMVVLGAALATQAVVIDQPSEPEAPAAETEGGKIDDGPIESQITTEDGSITFFDVLNKSIGVEVVDPNTSQKIIWKMMEKNSKLGESREKIFYTQFPNQGTVDIKVYEGENSDPQLCTYLGVARISDLPPGRPASEPIQVKLTSTKSGTIKVNGKDVNSGQKVSAEIKLTVAKSDEEIQARKQNIEEEHTFL